MYNAIQAGHAPPELYFYIGVDDLLDQSLVELFFYFHQHVVGHRREVEFGIPAPFFAGTRVVHAVGPAVGNRLLDGVDLVVHREAGDVFPDFGGDLLRLEAHGGDVEAVAVLQFRRVRFHQLHDGVQGVGHVHHVHVGSLFHVAGEGAFADGVIVDFDRVVGGASAGQGHIGNQSRETYAAGVHAEAVEIVVAQQFAGHLAHSVHGGVGTLEGVLRGFVFRGVVAERADGAGGEHRALVVLADVQGVGQGADVDVPCQFRVLFARGGEQGDEVEDGVDAVFFDNGGVGFPVQGVQFFEGTCFRQGAAFVGADIGSYHVVITVNRPQVGNQFGADLSTGAND